MSILSGSSAIYFKLFLSSYNAFNFVIAFSQNDIVGQENVPVFDIPILKKRYFIFYIMHISSLILEDLSDIWPGIPY